MNKKLFSTLATTLAVILGTTSPGEEIKHIFVATDESGKQLIYVDETHPEKDWSVPLPGNRDIQLSGTGTVLVNVADGYREYDLKGGKLIKSYGGKDKVDGVKTHFFADAQQLENGNIVVAHWSGHRREDSKKAPQALEFDKDGKVVWTWHDPKRAGSLHGIEIVQ